MHSVIIIVMSKVRYGNSFVIIREVVL